MELKRTGLEWEENTKQTISGTEASAPPATVPQTVESLESQPDLKDKAMLCSPFNLASH